MLTNHKRSGSTLENALSSHTISVSMTGGADTLVAAPGAGKRIRITLLSLVDTSAAANTVDVKSGSNTIGTLVLPASGGQVLTGTAIECNENEALIIDGTSTGEGTLSYDIAPA